MRSSSRIRRLPAVAIGLCLAFATLGGTCIESSAPAPTARPQNAPVTVLLTRHAEKVRGADDNPPLTAGGQKRAQALPAAVSKYNISAIYSTRYRRTRKTALPLVEARGLSLTLYSDNPRKLAKRLLREHRGDTILVVGHSNTVPQIIAALGVPDPVDINDNEYGDLFVVRVHPNGSATLQRDRFGD